MSEYAAILADPPWRFETWSPKGWGDKHAANHYDVSATPEIAALPVPAAENCVLFMWTTDSHLEQALWLMKEWDFQYKTVAFTWAKEGKQPGVWPIGMGHWTRANPEMCLLGTRGKPKRINADVRQLIVAPRREHSRKPDEIYERIERLVDGPFLEMFARQTRPGWDSWGDEVGKFDV